MYTKYTATPTSMRGSTDTRGLTKYCVKPPGNIKEVKRDIIPNTVPHKTALRSVGRTKIHIYTTASVTMAAFIENHPVNRWSSILAANTSAATVAYHTISFAVLFIFLLPLDFARQ